MSTMLLQRANCPVCGESSLRAPCVLRAAVPAEECSEETIQQSWMGLFKEATYFSYHRCTKCGLLFSPRYPSEEMLDRLYGAMPMNMSEVPEEALKKTQRGYVRLLRSYVSEFRGTYLELGPDAGFFAEACAESGAFEHFVFCEPNRAIHNELRKRFATSPHTIVDHLSEASGHLDTHPPSCIALIHVIDHLIDPVETLRKIRGVCRDNALLFVVCHNEYSWLARVLGGSWPPYCLQHPQVFHPSTLRRAIEAAGFLPLQIWKTANYFPLTYLLRHLAWKMGWKSKAFPLEQQLIIPLKLGNMAMIARALPAHNQ